MPTTVTWNDGVNTPTVFTIPDDVMAALEQFRQTVVSVQNNGQMAPTYTTVQKMLVGFYVNTVVQPALSRFPTTAIQSAQAGVATAQANLLQVQLAAIPGFVD